MNDLGSDIMLKKQTTNVALVLSISLAVNYGSVSADSYIYNNDELVACNYLYNNPEKIDNTRIDEYFKESYSFNKLKMGLINREDFEFLGVIQDFADSQIDLDKDFKNALESLTNKMSGREPKKKRF